MKWAESNPDLFYKLIVQLLPKEKTVEVTNRTATLEDLLLNINRESELHSVSVDTEYQ